MYKPSTDSKGEPQTMNIGLFCMHTAVGMSAFINSLNFAVKGKSMTHSLHLFSLRFTHAHTHTHTHTHVYVHTFIYIYDEIELKTDKRQFQSFYSKSIIK